MDRPVPSDAGLDAPRVRRPGVPRERTPARAPGAWWWAPARQPRAARAAVPATPVFGTAQPPHGLSGAVRRRAYRIPDHRARRWMLLLLADRIDVVESGAPDLARRWWPAAAVGAVGAAAALAAFRLVTRRG